MQFSAQLPQTDSNKSSRGNEERFERAATLSLLTLRTVAGSPSASLDGDAGARKERTQSLVDVGELFLVGVGAIGNGAVWALARTENVSGKIWLVDGELVDLSNLQRYVLTVNQSEGLSKVAVAAAEFIRARDTSRSLRHEGSSAGDLLVTEVPLTWDRFVAQRSDYRFDRVLLALDTAEDRIAAQSSLPHWIANAWTQADNLGISRHRDFESEACVVCLYMPTDGTKSREQLVAEALRVETDADRAEIKRLLHLGQPVGEDFLRRIAARFGACEAELLPFAGKNLDVFYAEAICGGLLLKLGGDAGLAKSAVVPMAFQSALAGILLAAEAVLSASGHRSEDLAGRTEIDLRRPLGGLLNSPTAKHPSGRCLCQDKIYIEAYRTKYR